VVAANESGDKCYVGVVAVAGACHFFTAIAAIFPTLSSSPLLLRRHEPSRDVFLDVEHMPHVRCLDFELGQPVFSSHGGNLQTLIDAAIS
jgi:hypothetical protein